MADIETIQIMKDNYAYVIVIGSSALVVDPGDAAPVSEFAHKRGLRITTVLLTHNHNDHLAGAPEIKRAFDAEVLGPKNTPGIDRKIHEGEELDFGGLAMDVLHTPGHSKHQLCFLFPEMNALFTGDTLFCGGCGRIFGSNHQAMWGSLKRLSGLPDETLVYCGHEYTEENLSFALTVLPEDTSLVKRLKETRQLRGNGRPTVPSTIGEEKRTNIFLRVREKGVKAALGMENAENAAVFAELRRRKDRY